MRLGEHVVISLHLMSDPSLWCWVIADAGTGAVVEGSWATHWVGFESRDEAGKAAQRRLATLRRSPEARRVA
jgi:hypothetical protein